MATTRPTRYPLDGGLGRRDEQELRKWLAVIEQKKAQKKAMIERYKNSHPRWHRWALAADKLGAAHKRVSCHLAHARDRDTRPAHLHSWMTREQERILGIYGVSTQEIFEVEREIWRKYQVALLREAELEPPEI